MWAIILFKEFFYFLRTIFSSFLSIFSIESVDKINEKDTPILLIHGYLNYSSVWLFHLKRLKKKGYSAIYTINLGSPFLSIEEYGKKVEKKAQQIAKDLKRKDLILIGHSMGGLVASYYASFLASGTVKKVITLGSPFKGTKMAKIGIGKCSREMETNSLFLEKLRKNIENSPDIHFFHLGTTKDQIILPYTSAFLGDQTSRHCVLDEMGHVGLLYSDRVSEEIDRWIRN